MKYAVELEGTTIVFEGFNSEKYYELSENGAGLYFEVTTNFGSFRFLNVNDEDDNETSIIIHFPGNEEEIGYYTMRANDYLKLVYFWIQTEHHGNSNTLDMLEHWLFHMVSECPN